MQGAAFRSLVLLTRSRISSEGLPFRVHDFSRASGAFCRHCSRPDFGDDKFPVVSNCNSSLSVWLPYGILDTELVYP